MDQRRQFIADHLRDSLTITDLCELYGVSRKTGYKWIDRYSDRRVWRSARAVPTTRRIKRPTTLCARFSSIPVVSKYATSAPTAAFDGNRRWVNVSTVCIGEYVGLEEIDDGIWNVYFGALKLGRLLERSIFPTGQPHKGDVPLRGGASDGVTASY